MTPAIPDRVYPPQVQILSELGRLFGKAALLVGQTFAVAVVDHCGVYWLLREPPEPPCIWRDLFGASRRCIVLPSVSADVWPPPTALYRQDNQLFDGTFVEQLSASGRLLTRFSSRILSGERLVASNGLQRPPVTSILHGRLRIDWIFERQVAF